MRTFKENDMSRNLSTTLAAFVALAFTFGSIGAIVTVPPAKAAATTAFGTAELA